ncbi:MAG: hypothetical protein R3F49_23465 [Planctomycetota bacterium]
MGEVTNSTGVARLPLWCGALVVAGLAALLFTPSPRERAARAADARTLEEYLDLRAEPPKPALPALGGALPPLVTVELGARALELVFPGLVDDPSLTVDDVCGPVATATLGLLEAPPERAVAGQEPPRPVLLLVHDDSGALADVGGLAPALAAEFGMDVVPAGAQGQSPIGHLGLLERACRRRCGLVVSVWNLADDLAETDVWRRVMGRLQPEGAIDSLIAELGAARDASVVGAAGATARARDAQERWLAEHPASVPELALTLAQVAFELERRAAIHGGHAVVLLVAPEGGVTPTVTEVLAGFEAALEGTSVRRAQLVGPASSEALVAAARAALGAH